MKTANICLILLFSSIISNSQYVLKNIYITTNYGYTPFVMSNRIIDQYSKYFDGGSPMVTGGSESLFSYNPFLPIHVGT